MAGSFDKTTWTYGTTTGLLLAKTDANNASVTYGYDAAGRMISRTWARGVVTSYGYDAATGQLVSTTYSDSTPSVSYTYDRRGRMASVVDGVGSRTFTAIRFISVPLNYLLGSISEATSGASGSAGAFGGGNEQQMPEKSATNGLIKKLRELSCAERKRLLDNADAAFNEWGEAISEVTQPIFGGKAGAPISVGPVIEGTQVKVFDTFVWNSGPALTEYFERTAVQEAIKESGLTAIFISHSDRVNESNLPSNIASITQASQVPTVLYNPVNITVISTDVKPNKDESTSSYNNAIPISSKSPGIEVGSKNEFVELLLEGCKK